MRQRRRRVMGRQAFVYEKESAKNNMTNKFQQMITTVAVSFHSTPVNEMEIFAHTARHAPHRNILTQLYTQRELPIVESCCCCFYCCCVILLVTLNTFGLSKMFPSFPRPTISCPLYPVYTKLHSIYTKSTEIGVKSLELCKICSATDDD